MLSVSLHIVSSAQNPSVNQWQPHRTWPWLLSKLYTFWGTVKALLNKINRIHVLALLQLCLWLCFLLSENINPFQFLLKVLHIWNTKMVDERKKKSAKRWLSWRFDTKVLEERCEKNLGMPQGMCRFLLLQQWISTFFQRCEILFQLSTP